MSQFEKRQLSELTLLEVDLDGQEQINAIPEAYRKVFSHYRSPNGRLYHLHPSMVREDETVAICKQCSRQITLGNIPKYSLKAGCDYGSLESFTESELPPLTALEELLISPVISFVNIVKLTASRSSSDQDQDSLKGHVICLPHNGREVLATTLPRQDVSNYISVTFIGTEEEWRRSRSAHSTITGLRDLRARAWVIGKWLRLFKAVNPRFFGGIHVGNEEEWEGMLSQLTQELLDGAHIATDEDTRSLERRTSADVAQARGSNEESGGGLDEVMVTDRVSTNAHLQVLRSLANTLGHDITIDSEQQVVLGDTAVDIEVQGPVNDFTDNDVLLMGSFPYLFPLGRGVDRRASLSQTQIRQLLYQYDGRFAQRSRFLFTLFNQMQRHHASRAVAARVKSNSSKMARFCKLVNASEFAEQLQNAINHPDDSNTQTFLRSIVPLLKISGGHMLLSPLRASVTICKLYGSVTYFGMPTFFVTMAP